jgi:hypothetical protein
MFMKVPANRAMNEDELNEWEALIDEEIRRYLEAHKGDEYDGDTFLVS